MTTFRGQRTAFGWPGIEPRWTQGNKDGVGTAYAAASRLWFTLFAGGVTEVYYPTVDRPQLRDLQYLISDGEGLFHEEKRDLLTTVELLSNRALGYRVTNADPSGRYRIIKEIIADPLLPCLLLRTRVDADPALMKRLRLFALCAPRLGGRGWGNNAYVLAVGGREILVAEKGGIWLAMAASAPFLKASCGYVGRSDGWTDVATNGRLSWEFDQATEGNVALTGEIDLTAGRDFTLGVAFGDGLHAAVTTLFQALGIPFAQQCRRFLRQWHRPHNRLLELAPYSADGGKLYHASASLLLAHEDKSFPGALIASLSIPWGEARGDDGSGGYHLVWTRDMVNSAMGLLAAGHPETPARALIYLAASQQPDGGFPQNFWINGEPHWRAIQLDEVAYPVLLAWRLHQEGALGDFDPYTMVMKAASYLVLHGPVTQQERWEEASGYSPSTLAVHIAALICAACFARERGEAATARYLEAYADFLEAHIEPWTVTTEGTLVPGITRHYIRVMPVDFGDPQPVEDPNTGLLKITNHPPESVATFPAKEVVDAGFLELVRYGIRRADDPLILDSLQVVDAILRVGTPFGPCWLRYNNDGYGQRADGGPYQGWGKGRPWPLLTGERAHYELAAGSDIFRYIETMEQFSTPAGMLPEQIWDEADRPDLGLELGRPTGAAMPLMWAHAEYIKLLRSRHDGRVFDLIEPVRQRYLEGVREDGPPVEIWKHMRQPAMIGSGSVLRVQAAEHFLLRWSTDDWHSSAESSALPTGLGVHYVDIYTPENSINTITFTFFWTDRDEWEGRDYTVGVRVGDRMPSAR